MANLNTLKDPEWEEEKIGLLFRSLRPEEVEAIMAGEGISPKNPYDVLYSVQDHITNEKLETRFVSFGAKLMPILVWAKKTHSYVVIIDSRKIDNVIYDFRQGGQGLGATHSNYAKSSFEVCVEGVIPAEAIVYLITPEQVLEWLKDNDQDTLNYFNYSLCSSSHKSSLRGIWRSFESRAGRLESWREEKWFNYMVKQCKALWTYNRKLDHVIKTDGTF